MDLKRGDEVVRQWAGVCCDWHVAVQLRQSSARHLGSVESNIIFSEKELSTQHHPLIVCSRQILFTATAGWGESHKTECLGITEVGFGMPDVLPITQQSTE